MALLPAGVAGAQSPARADLAAQVDSLAAAYLKSLPSASISIAVMRGSDPLVVRAYGLADREHGRAATPSTIYEIGSLTKQFTAAAIMRLVERGRLSLDDDLSRYVPTFPLQGHHVTIRNLLTHTSGIHNYTAEPAWRATWAEDLSPDSIVGFVARDTFDFAPGSAFRYSNTGYVLLGMVIEKVTGRAYADVLEDEFFRPLGLTRTRYCTKPPPDSDVARGYSVRGGEFVAAPYLSLTHPFAAGAICSSAGDIARWETLFHQGHVLTPASYELMTTPTVLTTGARVNYGFGLNVVNLPFENGIGSRPALAHNGAINGFMSQQFYVLADSLTVVVLTNTDAAMPIQLAGEVAQAALMARRPGAMP